MFCKSDVDLSYPFCQRIYEMKYIDDLESTELLLSSEKEALLILGYHSTYRLIFYQVNFIKSSS